MPNVRLSLPDTCGHVRAGRPRSAQPSALATARRLERASVSGSCFHGQREARAPSVARVPGAGAAARRNVWRLMLSGAAARAGACSASLCESEQAPRAFGSRCRFARASGTTAPGRVDFRNSGRHQQSGSADETPWSSANPGVSFRLGTVVAPVWDPVASGGDGGVAAVNRKCVRMRALGRERLWFFVGRRRRAVPDHPGFTLDASDALGRNAGAVRRWLEPRPLRWLG